MTKRAAHDKWVCLGCRWSAKMPPVDQRSKRLGYRCPHCRATMLWTGTAFRPPARDDDEAWAVLAELFVAGVRFHTTSQRRRWPRTRRELQAWVEAQNVPDGWLAERRVNIRRGPEGTIVRCGKRDLPDEQRLLVWHEDRWLEGRLRLSYGPKALPGPVVRLTERRRILPLASGSRVRLRRDP